MTGWSLIKLNMNKSTFIFKSINIVGTGIFRGFVYLQSSAGHIGAQTPVIIPVYTYLGEYRIYTDTKAKMINLSFYEHRNKILTTNYLFPIRLPGPLKLLPGPWGTHNGCCNYSLKYLLHTAMPTWIDALHAQWSIFVHLVQKNNTRVE